MGRVCLLCGPVGAGFTVHRFPAVKMNTLVRDKWLEFVMRRGIKRNQVTTWSKLCSKHFHYDDFSSTTVRRILRRNAFPRNAEELRWIPPMVAVDNNVRVVPHAVVNEDEETSVVVDDNFCSQSNDINGGIIENDPVDINIDQNYVVVHVMGFGDDDVIIEEPIGVNGELQDSTN